jgi:AraC-like DNA-binding protein
MEKLVSFIAWAAIIQGLFLATIYTLSKHHRSESNTILGLFLFALLWEAISIFASIDEIGGYRLWDYFAVPEVKMLIPLLFFHYVMKKLGRAKKYLPGLKILYFISLTIFSLAFVNLGLFLIAGHSFIYYFGEEVLETVFMTQQVAAWVLTILALIISFHETRQYKKKVIAEYSDLSMLQINWLRQFIFLMVPASLLWGFELLRIALGGLGGSDIVYATWGLLFIFIYFVSYKAFMQRDLFEVTAESLKPIHKTSEEPKNVIIENLDQIISTLEKAMTGERLFLKSDLTIHDLSKTIGIPTRKISQSINQSYESNFSEWVNKYRVEVAKQHLSTYSQDNITIEGIGYDSGFKSRSAMYLAFKKITGKTPGDFKQ